MMTSLVSLSLMFLCLGVTSGQVFRFGSCPDVPVQADFDVDRYYGDWYEFERYFFIAETFLKCSAAQYSPLPDDTIRVVNSGKNIITGSDSSVVGSARVDPNAGNPAKLLVTFGGMSDGPYWVVKTDYDQYSIVYSCTNTLFNRARLEILWILTRDRTGITEDMRSDIYQHLRQIGLDPSKLNPTTQTGC